MNNKTPTRANVIVLKQILNLIPREMSIQLVANCMDWAK